MSHHLGYVGAVVSAILFGVSSTFNKITLENLNPSRWNWFASPLFSQHGTNFSGSMSKLQANYTTLKRKGLWQKT